MEDVTPAGAPDRTFRVGYVPGVMPGKWERGWKELQRHQRTRHLELVVTEVADQLAHLRDGTITMCLARGEADVDIDKGEFHLIPLYREQPVVVVPVEHPAAAYDEIDVTDLADELDVLATNPGLSVKHGIETVAAGTGMVIVPMSLARLHNRKDVKWLPVHGVEESPVGLAWLKDPPADLDAAAREAREDLIQSFIGVVRGRTSRSSR